MHRLALFHHLNHKDSLDCQPPPHPCTRLSLNKHTDQIENDRRRRQREENVDIYMIAHMRTNTGANQDSTG